MSYDFRLEWNGGGKRLGKKGLTPEQAARLQRARDVLRAHEPGIEIEDYRADRFVARSAQLGDVHVQLDRITLGMSMGSEPRAVYEAIHGLLARFHGENYTADDPQNDVPVEYREDFAEFMQQYRGQFTCSDEEFAMWVRGETPPWWAERERLLEEGAEHAQATLPPNPHGEVPKEAEALRAAYLDAVRINDAAIERHGLRDFLRACSEQVQSTYRVRRRDGSHYPDDIDFPWIRDTLLDREHTLLATLLHGGLAPDLAFDQPQEMVLRFAWEFSDKPREAARLALMADLRQRLVDAGLATDRHGSGVCMDKIAYDYFRCNDAQAAFDLCAPLVRAARDVTPLDATLRHGDIGARVTEVDLRQRP